jgi:uridine kinase
MQFDIARTVRAIEAHSVVGRPTLVAIDGRSGVGKSTFAGALARVLRAAVVEGDDFFAGGVGLRTDSPAERAELCIDWRRQRAVLETLRQNRRATWHRFDWIAFDGSLEESETVCDPVPIVVLEGVYSGRPELADCVDVRTLLTAPPAVRLARLVAREGAIGPWEKQWHEAEDHYFASIVTPASFDLVLDAG